MEFQRWITRLSFLLASFIAVEGSQQPVQLNSQQDLQPDYNSNSSMHNAVGRQVRVTYVPSSAARQSLTGQIPQISKNGKESLAILGDSVDSNMFAYVQDALNFTAEVHLANVWAVWDEANGTWEGMARLLVDNRADYATGSTYLTRQRVQSFKFLAVGNYYELSAYIQIPPRTIDGFKDVTTSALRYFWPHLLGLIVLFALALRVFKINLSSAFLLTAGNLAQQGASLHTMNDNDIHIRAESGAPKDSIRILLYTMCVCFYVINAHVTAVLMSKFAIQYKSISNVQDLVDGGYTFGVLDDSYLIEATWNRDVPQNTPLARAMANPVFVTKKEGMARLLKDPKFALLTEVNMVEVLEKVTSSSLFFCDVLREITLEEAPILSSGFVQTGSNLSSPINSALIKMWSSGNRNRFWNLYEQMQKDARPHCLNLPDNSIHLAQLSTPGVVLCAGALLSLAICLLEKYAHTTSTSRSRAVAISNNFFIS